jgi:hypothetical protein
LAAVAAAATALVAAPRTLADDTWRWPRPSDVPVASVQTALAPNDFRIFNDYATPERVFSSRRTTVHYVVSGIDAPPLNDDEGGAFAAPERSITTQTYGSQLLWRYLDLRNGAPHDQVSFATRRTGGEAALIYRLESDTPGYPNTLVRIDPGRSNRRRRLTFRTPARLAERATHRPMLVVSNGNLNHAARSGVTTR